jgi:hypothetical protein
VAIAGAQSAVAVRKPLIAAPPAMRQVPLKPMCVDDQGAMSRPGDYSWTSRASDGTAHDCTPYGCSLATGLCRTSAATTNQCRPGYSWWATDNTCRQCAPGDTVDAQGRCVQANPNPQ